MIPSSSGSGKVAGPFKWLSYQEAHGLAADIGAGLVRLGLKKGDMVGIWGRNCYQWVLAEQACNRQSLVTVPLYDTLGEEALEFILNQTKVSVVVCHPDRAEAARKAAARCPALRCLIIMDDVEPPAVRRGAGGGPAGGSVSAAGAEEGAGGEVDCSGVVDVAAAGGAGGVEGGDAGVSCSGECDGAAAAVPLSASSLASPLPSGLGASASASTSASASARGHEEAALVEAIGGAIQAELAKCAAPETAPALDLSKGASSTGVHCAAASDDAAISCASGSGAASGTGSSGVSQMRLSDLVSEGRAHPRPPNPPSREDMATVCYTSGTTGTPKGAMMSHGNFVAGMAGATAGGVELHSGDVYLSYLPLAHLMERIVQACLFRVGAAVGFYQGDVTLLLGDLQALRPTVFVSVPRLFNRIHDKMTQGVREASVVRRALFHYAYGSKQHYLRQDGDTQHSLWDAVVFAKLRALLGGRVRLMLTGSAPISPGVKEFVQVVFSAPLFEGYGMTENTAASTITPVDARHPGHVGAPMPSNEIKLVDLPDMGYRASDAPCPRGEIHTRGANVFMGYLHDPARTKEALTADGWLRTGDVGRINADGTLSIIDRVKNLFKLAQGEYVAPEKIEGAYSRAPLVAQMFVHGDSLQPSLVAVVVPDPEVAAAWVRQKTASGAGPAGLPAAPKEGGLEDAALGQLCQVAEFRAAIQEQMEEAAKASKLAGFERARAVRLHAEAFTVENGLLTPTFKPKRPQLKKRFQGEIEAMYAELAQRKGK